MFIFWLDFLAMGGMLPYYSFRYFHVENGVKMAKTDKIRVNKIKDPSIPKQCPATLILKLQFNTQKNSKEPIESKVP